MRTYPWEDRERFFLELDDYLVYVDPHEEWYPGYSEAQVLAAIQGDHQGSVEIVFEAKSGASCVRSLYPRCIRCSKRSMDTRTRKDLNSCLMCDRCHQATISVDPEDPSVTFYGINEDGSKGSVIK